jgi:hypothetical protein
MQRLHWHHFKHSRHGVLLALSFGLASALLGYAASANAFHTSLVVHGGCLFDEGCNPDDFNHTSCWRDTGTNPGAMGDAWVWADDNTSFTMLWSGSDCSGDKNMYMDDNLSDPGLRGLYTCNRYNGDGRCVNAAVSLNNSTTTTSERRGIWCHEIGHSFGARHDNANATCMATGAVADTLGPADITRINCQREHC